MKKTAIKNAILMAGVVNGSVFSSMATAFDQPAGFYMAPAIGYHVFDDQLPLKDDISYSLGAGYKAESNWIAELAYSYTDTQNRNSQLDVDTEYWHLDGLYYFENKGQYTPYIVFGVGEIRYDYDAPGVKSPRETQWTLGPGVSYAINSDVEVRADIRGLIAENDHESAVFDMGIAYYFGHIKTTPKAAPVVVPVPKQAEPVVIPPPVVKPEPVVEKDTDDDGVKDGQDKCPDTSKGAMVDAEGCYKLLTKTKELTLNVRFQSAKSVIEPATKGEVENLAKFLMSYPQTNVVVEGHTDSIGSAEYNKKLSQQRADAVKQSLINDYGIAAGRVTAIGYGEEKPIADNATKEGQAENRRVVAKVSAQITERQ